MRSVNVILSGAREGNARQVTAAADKVDGQLQASAGLPFDEDLRFGTRGSARPAVAWLEARLPAGGTATEVNFIGRGALQGSVSPVSVVPDDEETDFAIHGAVHKREDRQSSRAFLERADEALDPLR